MHSSAAADSYLGLESTAPRPRSQPSATSPQAGGKDQAVSSPYGAV
ncbi:hypothetical protein ACPXCO_29575 [Streptomyces cyaneofuscatus]|nr:MULTISPECIES: hypothetical protein [unclassified Streptomyces]ONI52805.1 hypothetical protein STIB_33660 [Streptomyces sp. IB2014 011-1]